ncbi:MAG: DUF11 domain-containing protein, partial [Anaerolineales bacterium]|nr:DUF11 domain-containing protein [Anaerolineales bacterium]
VAVAATQVTETAVSAIQPAPTYQVTYPDAADLAQTAAALAQQLEQPAYLPDPAIYQQAASYPSQRYAVSDVLYYRDWRLVRLTLYPLQVNPVAGTVSQAADLAVSIRFAGAQPHRAQPLPDPDGLTAAAIRPLILNAAQAMPWRHLPDELRGATATQLPIGVPTYKIEVAQDGIYEISAADLQAAGMNIAAVNPATIQMLYRGAPVAVQRVDDGDATFELGESIRFYGWAFSGSRLEKQFVGDWNVYWLWAGGTQTAVSTAPNEAGQGHPVQLTFPESITRDDPEQYHYHTRTNAWPIFPNEPDAWYMDYVRKTNALDLTRTYTLTLPYPAASGPDASLLIEVMDRDSGALPHTGYLRINSSPPGPTQTFNYKQNANLVTTVPITYLQHLANDFHYVSTTGASSTLREEFYVNRVTVDYTRQLIATGDELAFGPGTAGAYEFHVASFTESTPGSILVWDVTTPTLPVQIDMTGQISSTGGTFTYKIGRTLGANGRFLATTTANLRTPLNITQYTPPNLDPAAGAAWIAISHQDFLPQAQQLAAHRADPAYTNLATQVVDIADVVNQYGYGLPMPFAVRDYLAHALSSWSTPPRYVTLFGDANFNPLHRDCLNTCYTNFDPNEPIYLLTDLIFIDRFQGLIPSDYTMALLSGGDELADVAIGRIAAGSTAEAETAVGKIIRFETIQTDPAAREHHENILFVADMADTAGDFCAENNAVGGLLPAVFNQTHLCLSERTDPAVTQLQDDMSLLINGPTAGLSILNYRGHGSVENWVKGSYHPVSTTNLDFWQNFDHPLVILSADCLDGYFTYPGVPGLGESILKLGDPQNNDFRGSVAHWSSTGLGLTQEHTDLLTGVYSAVFTHGLTTIGDATVYGKLYYLQRGNHDSEAYSFTLQGDPAMPLFRPDLSLTKTALQGAGAPGDTISFRLDLANSGLYPAQPRITETLPPGLEFVTALSTTPLSTTVSGSQVTINLLAPLPEGETASVTVQTRIAAGTPDGVLTNQASVGPGVDLDPSDNSDSATVVVINDTRYAFLPAIRRP